MSLADDLLASIRSERETRFEKLRLPPDWIAPNYGGRSVVNVAASLVSLFGGRIASPPLNPPLFDAFSTGTERVVYVVIDALGYHRLRDTLDSNPDNGLHGLLRKGAQLVPITSTFPSTTTAALTSLWSGYSPAEHGLLGYQLFLRDLGVRADMILFSPVAMRALGHDQLLAAGLEADKFVVVPSLPQTLAQVGVPTFHLILYPFAKSGLSQAQIRGAREVQGFITGSDMWVVLRQRLEELRGERAVFAVYWSGVDGIAHTYGPSSETLLAEVNNLAYSFEREFLRPLSPAARQGTLFVLTADHGQIDTPPDQALYLSDHPELRERLVMDFAGEPRAAYLYCRGGEVQAAREYLTNQLGHHVVVLDSAEALECGLFGPGVIAPETRHRLGDLIVLPRENRALLENKESRQMLGRHGGLTEQEMLVPLLVARLDP